MSKLKIAVLGVILSSCAHTHIESWNSDQITACGNKWADSNDLREEAQKSCGGTVKPVAGYMQDSGAVAMPMGNSIMVKPTRQSCMVFSCEKREPASN